MRDYPLARLRTELHSCRRMIRPSVVYAFPPVYVSHINLVNVIPYLGLAFLLGRETALAICGPIHGVAAVQVALGFSLVL